MISKNDIIQAASTTAKYVDQYDIIGLRCDDRVFDIGDILPASWVWIDGEKTDEQLPGTSAIGIGKWDIDSVQKSNLYGYPYDHLYIVGGGAAGDGEDAGEVIILNARVLKILK